MPFVEYSNDGHFSPSLKNDGVDVGRTVGVKKCCSRSFRMKSVTKVNTYLAVANPGGHAGLAFDQSTALQSCPRDHGWAFA